jgi:outer membrane murein-binding lipoprotein Lpp
MTTSTSLPVDWEDSLKKIISAEFNSHVKNVADEVQRRMKSEITDSLLPEIVRTVTKTMEQSVVKPLQASMDKALKQSGEAHTDAIMAAISGSVEQPLNEAFTESMKSTLIPAYESATREIMFQVSKSVASARSAGPSPDLSAKLDTMAMAIKDLTAEVTQLRSIMNSQAPLPQAPRSVPRPSPADQMEVTRKNILTEIEAGNYETAFTKALSLSTTDMAIFCCKHADLSAVLGGEKSALSQPILLCLMQQLGAAIALSSGSDLEVFVSWLQEIALTLDPANESIVRHVPGVLQQLVGNINAKIQSDPSMRRRLQMLLQVIRGML